MHVSPVVSAAIDRVEQRAADVRHAFTPGAPPIFDDAGRDQTSFPTLDPLSVAAPDGAYFIERGEAGEARYTRGGSFVLRDGRLCAPDGRPVLGATRRGVLEPIAIDPVDLSLGRARAVHLDASGALMYERRVIDPRTGCVQAQSVVAGRLALARFAAGTRLQPDGDGATAPPGITPHVGVPGDGSFAPVAPMRRESSGVDVDRSIDRLRIAYRQLDAMQAAFRAQYGAEKSAIDLVK
ncbi:MAG: flagellar hook-basal body protein [Candidatus Tyrphobacter sp.]